MTLAGGLGTSPLCLAARRLSASNLLNLFSPHPVSFGARLVMLLREGPQVLLAPRFHFPCELGLTAHYGIALK